MFCRCRSRGRATGRAGQKLTFVTMRREEDGAVVMVPQEGFLFDATLLENVRFGRPEASAEDVELAITELGLGAVEVDVNGVGYFVAVSSSTIRNLRLGEKVRLLTQMVVREDSMKSRNGGAYEPVSNFAPTVGTGAGQIKIGSIVRGERLVKYNRLLRIEEEFERGEA